VAEPWTHDLQTLGARTRIGLRSVEQVRAAVPKERPPMRLFKHPALAAIIILAILGITAPIAYAIVDRVWLSVDVDKSADEIQNDVNSQLEQQGISGTDVKVSKDGNQIGIDIKAGDPALGSNLEVVVPNLPDNAEAQELRLEVTVPLTDAQQAKLTQVVSSSAFTGLLDDDTKTPAQVEAGIRDQLAAAGFKDVDVKVSPAKIAVTIKSAPQA
jgi:hypothetical protein